MIRNIIFDMGNVLLDYDPDVSLRKYCHSAESMTLIKNELFLGDEWRQGDLGIITNDQRYDGVSKRIPQEYLDELRDVVDHWDICMVPLPGAKEYVYKKKEEGFRLYVLSNACAKFYHYFPAQFDMELFDGIVVSSNLHIVKPDERIYRYLLDTYHLKPEECAFIDDVELNVQAAGQMGIHGIVFNNSFDEVEEQLKKIG